MKKKKYAMGTSVKNQIETPVTEAQKIRLMGGEALYEAKSDPWINALDIAGKTAMQAGLSVALPQMGMNPQAANLIQSGAMGLDQGLSGGFAMGGQIPGGIPVEIEGKEMVQMPGQQSAMEAVGPSHENGGIKLSLPEGTEIFSDRVKIDGVSMSDRKKKRDKKSMKLEDLMEMSMSDSLLKSTQDLTTENNQIEETKDQQLQQFITDLLPQKEEISKHATDPVVGGDPSVNPFTVVGGEQYLEGQKSQAAMNFNNFLKSAGGYANENANYAPTLGDSISLGGSAISTFAPYFNTLKNRSQDTPNQNFFTDYGNDALERIEESKGYVDQNKEQALSDSQYQSNATQNNLRNSARGVNQLRALDIANKTTTDRANNQIYTQFANQMMQILHQQAGVENQQDQVFMGAEAQVDLSNRQDNDNFSTQLGADKSNIGYGLQHIGKDVNQIKYKGDSIESIDNQEEQAKQNEVFMQFLQKALENYTKVQGNPQGKTQGNVKVN